MFPIQLNPSAVTLGSFPRHLCRVLVDKKDATLFGVRHHLRESSRNHPGIPAEKTAKNH